MPEPAEPQPAEPSSPGHNPTEPRPAHRPTGWRKSFIVFGLIVVSVSVILLLQRQYRARHPAPLPTWPLRAGDVLRLVPGDPNIAKWAEDLTHDGFVVRQLASNGHPIAGAKTCALEPDYMADALEPGGNLTLLDQQPGGDWRVRWTGGDTLPPYLKKSPNFGANCGRRAILQFTPDQLHAFLDILAGVATSVPPSTSHTEP